ncbi:hypothetical protein [Iodobacter sp.]|uniref:hypothetical protein n=1 Tax=Iodobacter sp. TaxID=1915058 RepID=UPI0025E4FF56|nr:hypothetical protein [Iodobacter sp.]
MQSIISLLRQLKVVVLAQAEPTLKSIDKISMKKKLYKIFLLFFIYPIGVANANIIKNDQYCHATIIDLIGHTLKLKNFRQNLNGNGVIISSVCKALPKEKNTIVAAIAYTSEENSKIEGISKKELFLSLIDTRSNKILSSYRSFIIEDASMRLEENSLRIDTAAYYLAGGVRAFGLDISGDYMPNCGDGSIGARRTLYIREEEKIRPVLEDFFMSTSWFIKGSNCQQNENERVVEHFQRSISVGKNVNHGFNDLLITIKSEIDDGSQSKRKPFYFTLNYDGKTYSTKLFEESYLKWQR